MLPLYDWQKHTRNSTPTVAKTPVTPKGDNNQIVLKKKYTIDPLDILKGAGDFRFKTKEDLLKKW